ncbi:MAG: CcmD family protein [Polyangiaceae bacterium]|nr:CcmD family protein [Polyangiaceae bacterium]
MSPPGAPGSPGERAAEFVSVEGGAPGAGASAEALLVAAYIAMWAIVVVFLATSWRSQRRLDSRLAELERRLERGGVEGDRRP